MSVRDFIKIQTVLRVDEKGFLKFVPVAEKLAKAEGLKHHARSVKIRRE
ncbi:MAG: histidinol dehydrogenase [Candidatus Aminicenantales bacterium]